MGVCTANFHGIVSRGTDTETGSIPEREASTGNLYNTSTVYSPQGSCAPIRCVVDNVNQTIGELVALHRKVHLFDIDIPGKISFKVRTQSPLGFLRVISHRPMVRKVKHLPAAARSITLIPVCGRLRLYPDHPGTPLTAYSTEFARIGLGICYDVRFPELTAIGARKGSPALRNSPRLSVSNSPRIGCQVFIYPGAFNLTTGPLHWQLLQQAR